MAETVVQGEPASPGLAVGPVWRPRAAAAPTAARVKASDSAPESERALAALAAAAREMEEIVDRLPSDERDIIAAGVLMAQDPALADAVVAAARGGLAAEDAITRETGRYAEMIASLGDATLAARAEDVRSLGRRARRLAGEHAAVRPPARGVIAVADELGPADVAEHADALAGVALAAGGATAHAAIVARALGIPMVTGVGAALTAAAEGAQVVLDGDAGTVTLNPAAARIEHAARAMGLRRADLAQGESERDRAAVTLDGTRVGVLANVALPHELAPALRAGAEGIGLLRTEMAFLDARAWPSETDHAAALAAILDGLGSRPVIVRVLDYGGDKLPPFLAGSRDRGIALLLAHPEPFLRQLRAICRAARGRDLRVMVPLVETAEQLAATRRLLCDAAAGDPLPPLGAMVETVPAVEHVRVLAGSADFLSIGTNDLAASVLGADRFAAGRPLAHHPRVLRAIADIAAAAREAGLQVEVCGEAASDPVMVPLLVGLGIDDLSVGAARVAEVRRSIRRLDRAGCAALANAALAMDSAEEVAAAVAARGAGAPRTAA